MSVPFLVATSDLLLAMQAAKRPWRLFAMRFGAGVPLAVGLVIVALLGPVAEPTVSNVTFLLWALGMVAAGLYALASGRRMLGARWPGSVRELVRRGSGSHGAPIGDWIVVRADRYVVVAIVGTSGLGVFSVAASWAEICLFAGNAIGQAMFEDETTLDQTAAKRLLLHTAWIIAAIAAVIVVAAFILIRPVFREDFESARWVVLLLAPGMVARSLAYSAGNVLLARGRGK